MVIKTEACSFSELRIYPGHGKRFIAKDGRSSLFIDSKCRSLFHQRIKPVKLHWTQTWRRHNKKGKVEEVTRRRTRRTAKMQKAIVGASLEEIKKKRTPAAHSAARDAALREVKERKKKTAATKTTKAAPAAQNKAATKSVKGKGR
eukprot:GILJ01000131.1.p2 GENE.GILJ01000131.1~~GILJ01000131.1.p2  ORF type:complete len:146 (+),score=36.98 GILJ01000131.1:46-483(+)